MLLNFSFFSASSIKPLHWRFLLASLAAFGSLLIGEHVYLDHFITTDENSYVFQAWLFMQGVFRLPAPVLEEALFHRMIILDQQAGWLSRYPPAHSLWLVPGVAIGYPRLMIAVAAFLSFWFLTKAGERLKVPMVVTAVLLLISPYFWLMQGSVLSHTSGLAALSLMTWAYFVWNQERKVNYLAIAGFAWAFLFLNRTYTAIWIAIPFGVHALSQLYYSRSMQDLKACFIFAICASSGLWVYFFYNYLVTGNPLQATYLFYNPLDGPGFGVRTNPTFTHTLSLGLSYLKNNLVALDERLWGFHGSLLVWLGLTLAGWRKGLTPMMLSATVLVWVAYVGFWYPGITEVAPVYYYETLVFLILNAGLGITRIVRMASARFHVTTWTSITVALCFVSYFSATTFGVYANVIYNINKHKVHYTRMIRSVPPNSFLVMSHVSPDLLDVMSWNPQGMDSDPVILRDGYGLEHVLYHLYPERSVYRIQGDRPKPPQRMSNTDGRIPVFPAHVFRSKTGNHLNGEKGVKRIAQESEHSRGVLAYGIKQYMIPGTYEITYHLTASGKQGEVIGHADLVLDLGKSTSAKKSVSAGDNKIVFNVDVDQLSVVEPRLHFSGNGRLEFDRVEIKLLGNKGNSI